MELGRMPQKYMKKLWAFLSTLYYSIVLILLIGWLIITRQGFGANLEDEEF